MAGWLDADEAQWEFADKHAFKYGTDTQPWELKVREMAAQAVADRSMHAPEGGYYLIPIHKKGGGYQMVRVRLAKGLPHDIAILIAEIQIREQTLDYLD